MENRTTNILIFACQYCSYAAADLAGSERRRYPANTSIIRLPCTGRVDESHLLAAFENGADGVMVAGCLEGTCHFLTGNFRARARVQRVTGILENIGLNGKRLRMYNLSAGQGANFANFVTEFVELIDTLGSSPVNITRAKAPEFEIV
ncbi:MAG: hydrogenase iron-sulfur subunit [Proteobacteria bacterium]|nr:hydrogenase iron-sulfur subunit [Pseudomonadota bacterium]